MTYHIPVLLNETIDALQVKPDGIYADGTLGGAGHAYEIAKRLDEGGRLYGFDKDADAIAEATKRLAPFQDRVMITKDNYENAVTRMKEEGVEKANGILLDIGVSSHQFDDALRGFSYRMDAPLDMRMDTTQEVSARTIVNEYDETELFHIIRDYGEEPFAKNIAKHIVKQRALHPVETTFELNEIIKAAIPARMRQGKGHPSKRTFQALRIACNRELEVLENAIPEMIDFLAPSGRLAIITFHSLEDKIVKKCFRQAENPCTCPASFPVCVCGKKPKGRIVKKKAITASEEELEKNHRAQSAHLRIFEHV